MSLTEAEYNRLTTSASCPASSRPRSLRPEDSSLCARAPSGAPGGPSEADHLNPARSHAASRRARRAADKLCLDGRPAGSGYRIGRAGSQRRHSARPETGLREGPAYLSRQVIDRLASPWS
jgi:hypothetical protein